MKKARFRPDDRAIVANDGGQNGWKKMYATSCHNHYFQGCRTTLFASAYATAAVGFAACVRFVFCIIIIIIVIMYPLLSIDETAPRSHIHTRARVYTNARLRERVVCGDPCTLYWAAVIVSPSRRARKHKTRQDNNMKYLKLRSGGDMPIVGYGTWQVSTIPSSLPHLPRPAHGLVLARYFNETASRVLTLRSYFINAYRYCITCFDVK